MNKRIVYPTASGIAVIIPITNQMRLEEVAKKDVPTGTPYRIVDASEIPTDRTFRNAWTMDFSNPDGHGIGADAWFQINPTSQGD